MTPMPVHLALYFIFFFFIKSEKFFPNAYSYRQHAKTINKIINVWYLLDKYIYICMKYEKGEGDKEERKESGFIVYAVVVSSD